MNTKQEQPESKLMECLRKLIDNPVAAPEYRIRMVNLCSTIETLSHKLLENVDWMDHELHTDDPDYTKRHLTDATNLALQILTLSEIVGEMVNKSTELEDVAYWYEMEYGGR